MKKYNTIVVVVLLSNVLTALGQGPSTAQLQQWNEAHFPTHVEQFLHYLSLPNVSSDTKGIATNVNYIAQQLQAANLEVSKIDFLGVPYLYAEKTVVGTAPTVLFYVQLDAQPVAPTAWAQKNPFVPVIKRKTDAEFVTSTLKSALQNPKDHYVFARASSDSKGPAFSLITALQLLHQKSISLPYNIKIIGDFQEELGSPTIPEFVAKNRELLAADAIVILDGTRHSSNQPTLTYGARGIATLQLIYHGANTNLHSGQYGNIIPNPVFEMGRLLGNMKDEKGRVLIPDFYKGIRFTPIALDYFKGLPESFESLSTQLGSKMVEEVAAFPQQSFHYPSLNVRGMQAGWTGAQVRTIIPNQVVVEMDLRLVPETPGKQQIDRVLAFIAAQGFTLLDHPPTEAERLAHKKIMEWHSRLGSIPFRTPIEHPLGAWLEKGIENGLGPIPVVKASTTGGSQPIGAFINALQRPAIAVRIPNPNNNIHGPNENLCLQNLKEGIGSCLGILTLPFYE